MVNIHSYSRLHCSSQAMNRLLIILSLCVAAAYCDSSEEEVPEGLQNIPCLNSKLVVEEMSSTTYIKIMSDTGEILFEVNSNNTKASKMWELIVETTIALFPDHGNKTDFYITHKQVDGGIEVKMVDRTGEEVMKNVVPELPGIQPGRTTCARILHFDLIMVPEWDINRRDGYNMTSLVWSCYFGLTDLAKSLVERGANVNEVGFEAITPLTSAIRSNRDELVEFLLQKGALVDGPRSPNVETPLQMAAHMGRLNAARMLLEHGAQVDATGDVRMTPLLFATYDGNLDLVELLLKKGANVNALNSHGQTPLHVAVILSSGAQDLIHKIIQAGADVNVQDSDGNTPLILAISKIDEEDHSLELVQHLLHHHNPNVNVHNNEGKTALSIAATKGYSKVQELLKSKGAI